MMFPLKARVRNKTGTQEWMECIRETKRYYISQAVDNNGNNIRYNKVGGKRVGMDQYLQVSTVRPVNVPFDLRIPNGKPVI
ncbi:hypothetical protein AVU18_gp169 [Citrobacter phage IME-CF2]|jgi:hypothetical protein|uniref:Uncharacterized protein n=2 Tax=Pseudotevenvirus TaxID=2842979 RepID=A0A0K0QSF6_9CAUD|nr:hypothetical protein AVU18_gp169 [Citrobacter phage IME-CF2]AKR16061.1 hypothetical protein [Citrobacter phage IME-CF2]QPX73159.1 hypothetical protein [Citrobacter phage vB_Cfr_Xman]